MSVAVLKALAVALELSGTTLSEPALRQMAADLDEYPEAAVLAALDRCRRQVDGRLTLAKIVSQIRDGRPGPEEAWASVSRTLGDETVSIVWTEEMRTAFGVCASLADDPIAARMAFLEAYRQAVTDARAARERVRWSVSLGHDRQGREGVLLQAVEEGKLTATHALRLLAGDAAPATVARLQSLAGECLAIDTAKDAPKLAQIVQRIGMAMTD